MPRSGSSSLLGWTWLAAITCGWLAAPLAQPVQGPTGLPAAGVAAGATGPSAADQRPALPVAHDRELVPDSAPGDPAGRPAVRRPGPLRIVIDPALAASGSDAGSQPHTGSGHASPRDERAWTNRLDGHAAFLRYSSPVSGIPFTKFVINPVSGTVYYFWTAVFPFHYNFVSEVLIPLSKPGNRGTDEGLARISHAGWDRALLLGSIGYQNGVHGFEFLEADTPTPAQLRFAHARLKDTFTGVDLRFRPISAKQQALAVQVPDVPWIGADFITSAASYQCLNEGQAVGRLRVLGPREDAAKITFDPGEIVVLDEVPMDITPVAGILATRLTTPLSHVNLRATAWGIPNAGMKGAHQQADALSGKIVFYEVRPTGLVLSEATARQREEYEASRRMRQLRRHLQVPPVDLAYRGLPALEGLTAEDARRVGAKAANLGVLATRGSGRRFRVPPGLAIPFAYYQDHLQTNGLHHVLKRLLDDAELQADELKLRAALLALQQQIREAPLDRGFTEQLLVRTRYLLGNEGLFVRSSTNAEDLPGFNGAGLYDSVPNVRGDEALLAAIKQVWASVWNYRAFRERELYGIDHRAVFGGVILQVGIEAEAAGVLITQDVFRPGASSGVTINAKRGLGIRVVDGKRVPEQVLYDEEADEIRIISRSDDSVALRFDAGGGVRAVEVDNHQPVLGESRIRGLVAAAQEVRGLFPGSGPLDVEWLVKGDQVFLVQARPYVRSAEGGAARPASR